MMETGKKQLLFGLAAFGLLIVVLLCAWGYAVRPRPEPERPAPASVDWMPIQEMDEYETLFDSAIVEMSLEMNYPEEVTFSDSDLLEKWEAYLSGLEVKWDSYWSDDLDGGLFRVRIKTETGEFELTRVGLDQGDGILMGGSRYLLSKSIDSLFDETYELAEERHGAVSLFE